MKGQVEPHEGLTPEREMERGDVEGEGRGNARGATLPGTALLETFIAKATPRPPQDERQALGNEIDRLVSEQTPLDVIAEALERFHEKRRYGPSLLRRLASDVVADRAKAARGSPNGARLHHNQEATNGVLQRAMERAREADARESAAGRTQ